MPRIGNSPPLSLSQQVRTALSREQKEHPEIRWCQNNQIFEGFSDFQKIIKFLYVCISEFLYFFGIPAISREQKELPEIRWCQNNQIF